MAITRTRSEILELLDEAKEIDRRPWRHGSRVRYLVEESGKHFAFWVDVHTDEGAQVYGDVLLTEVRPQEVTVTQWVDVVEEVAQ